MSAADDTLNRYELRRQSRGGDAPPQAARTWRYHAVVWGSVLVAGLVVTGIVVVWYKITYVPILHARLRAFVIELSPGVDGKVTEVNVKEGDLVTKGQVLVRLDDLGLQSALAAAEAELAMRERARLEAEAREALTAARVEADIAVAEARAAVAEVRARSFEADVALRGQRFPELVREAEAVLAQREAAVTELVAGARPEEVETARARIAAAKAMLDLYDLEVRQSRELVEEGIDSQYILEVRRTRLDTQKHALRQAELALDLLLAGARPEAVEAARRAVDKERASVALVRLGKEEVARLDLEVAVRHAEVAEAKALLEQAKARRGELLVAQRQAEAAATEVDRARALLDGRMAALADAEVTSPLDGIVTRVYADVGELARRGESLVMVRDPGRERWFDAFVDEEDARLISVGQTAAVRVPANSSLEIPARVVAMGMHTATLDHGGNGEAGGGAVPQPDRVWLKLVPAEPLGEETVSGTTARGRIRVR